MKNETEIKITFFGTSNFSVFCLDELKKINILPSMIITSPDKPAGRGLKIETNPVKTWAETNKVPFLTPNKIDPEFVTQISKTNPELFLVASYGKIIPKSVLNLPKHGTLNIHPSLLPKYRGPSPLQEQILNDEKNIGVTIMLMDEQVDHGPIIAQEKVTISNWPVSFEELEKITAHIGVKILSEKIPTWLEGKIEAEEQRHSEATFTKKIKKEDGMLDIINGDPYKNFLKIQAFRTWPQTYFFAEKGAQKIRVIIKDAKFENSKLEILKVLPEGKKEMSYSDFLRGGAKVI